MKIALIAPNPTYQTEDLEREAKSRGHKLERIKLMEVDITNPHKDKTINQLANYDTIYFRNGADRVTKMILGKTLKEKNRIFINSGYYSKPLMSDKFFQNYTVAKKGITTPRTLSLKKSDKESYKNIVKRVGQPFIIKPSTGAKGIGVELIKSESDYYTYFKNRAPFKRLIQDYIENDGDYRILVVNHKAIGTFKRIPPKGDFRANISQGGHGEVVKDRKFRNKLFEIAEKITPLLDLEIAGIDLMRSKKDNKLYFIESNSIPQWEGFRGTTGINVAGKIIDYFEEIYGGGKGTKN